jgi:hypothetical protein
MVSTTAEKSPDTTGVLAPAAAAGVASLSQGSSQPLSQDVDADRPPLAIHGQVAQRCTILKKKRMFECCAVITGCNYYSGRG